VFVWPAGRLLCLLVHEMGLDLPRGLMNGFAVAVAAMRLSKGVKNDKAVTRGISRQQGKLTNSKNSSEAGRPAPYGEVPTSAQSQPITTFDCRTAGSFCKVQVHPAPKPRKAKRQKRRSRAREDFMARCATRGAREPRGCPLEDELHCLLCGTAQHNMQARMRLACISLTPECQAGTLDRSSRCHEEFG
jgi:hypothetical protein